MEAQETIKSWGQLYHAEAVHEAASDIFSAVRPANREILVIRCFLITVSLLTLYALFTLDYRSVDIPKALMGTVRNFETMFFHPGTQRLRLESAVYEVLITMGLAFLTTLFGGVIALFLGLLGARNLAPEGLTRIVRGFVAFIRAVPTILWVLIFAVAAGLGSAAAVIGMTFHSISYLTKAYSESFEELDRSVIEALSASGADWWQIVFQAVIPSSATYLLSWTFIRFEINFANAIAMGAAAGAAGIGFDLFMAGGYYFDLKEVGLITYIILAFAIILEMIATGMKSRIHRKA